MRVLLVAALFLLAGCADNDSTDPDVPEENEVEHNHDPLTFSDSGTLIAGTQGVDACGLVGAPLDTAVFNWEIPEEKTYKDLTVDLSWGATGLDLDLFVDGPNGSASSTSFNPLDGAGELVVFSGELTPGTYTITVIGCTNVATDFTVTGNADPVDDHE